VDSARLSADSTALLLHWMVVYRARLVLAARLKRPSSVVVGCRVGIRLICWKTGRRLRSL